MKYVIEMKIGLSKYWMATFGKNNTPFWTGIRDNAKKFHYKNEAIDWAHAETTMKTEIIAV